MLTFKVNRQKNYRVIINEKKARVALLVPYGRL